MIKKVKPITVRNSDLPSPELARLRFDAARRAYQQPAGDGTPNISVALQLVLQIERVAYEKL
jgi:hypothetical protein